MPIITVFTPTYNRCKLLTRAYHACQKQTCKDFIWLIVDDGSTDHTEETVHAWQDESNAFEIRYIKKANQGVHSAYNTAIMNTDTELLMAVDSDDYMPEDSVETAVNFWKQNGSDEYAGIVSIDRYQDGTVVGDMLPEQKSINLIDLLIGKYKINNGDRTDVVRTDLYRSVLPNKGVYDPIKQYEPHMLHLEISKNYDFLVLNHSLKTVEYQNSGLTNTLYQRYLDKAECFMEIRREYMTFHAPFMFKLKTSIHYVSSCFLAKKANRIFCHDFPVGYSILALIPGFFLSSYIKTKCVSSK
jgi:glycosyltransferase involved in cell wall biosynthesis